MPFSGKLRPCSWKKNVVSSSGSIPQFRIVWYSLYHIAEATSTPSLRKRLTEKDWGTTCTVRSYFLKVDSQSEAKSALPSVRSSDGE